ncbi:MAG: hypothetical protein HC769_20770 [Cyanobacteria bacterium CRU_2_1]|nr:hypothetical protein [Cyanobacteria bacterium CRU_2_1]
MRLSAFLKTWLLSLLLLIASTVLIANAAFSSPLFYQDAVLAQTQMEPSIGGEQPEESVNPQTPEGSEPKADETGDRQRTDEEAAASSTSDQDQSQSAGPYDMESIKAFNRALYGS